MAGRGFTKEQQMEAAKELRASWGQENRARGRGPGLRQSGRGAIRGGIRYTSPSSPQSFSPSPYTARQGVDRSFDSNGGFSPAASVAISSAPTSAITSTSSGHRPPLPAREARVAAQQANQVSPPVFRMAQQPPKRVASDQADGAESIKRAKAGGSPHVESRPTFNPNQYGGARFVSAITLPESSDVSGQQYGHARGLSNSGDIEMTDISSQDGDHPDATQAKHGGMRNSRWAMSHEDEDKEDDGGPVFAHDHCQERPIGNFIPARFSNPTPAPSYIQQQQGGFTALSTSVSSTFSSMPRTYEGPRGSQSPSSGNTKKTSQESNVQNAPDLRRLRGGLAASRFA